MPSRASSCRRRPSTLSADTIGGICWMTPVRLAATTVTDDREVDRCHVEGGGDDAVGVQRVGLDAEHDLTGVALGALGDEPEQTGDVADPDDQHAGGAGVEGAGVADAALAQTTAQHADDVVAGDAGRLVDDRDPVHTRRTPTSHRGVVRSRRRRRGRRPRSRRERPRRPVASSHRPERSARRMLSMRSAERITSSGRNCRIGVFLARIWRAIELWIRRRCSSRVSRMTASDSSPPSES